jgi:hypothetical protein
MKWFSLFIVVLSYSLMASGEVCVEEKQNVYSDFVPLSFDGRRTEVGNDQVQPVKDKLIAFISFNSNINITDITVTDCSSKAPLYISLGGRKIVDPMSDARNMSLAQERARFVSRILNDLKASSSSLSKVNFNAAAELAGPDFIPLDLNNRFATKMSPNYEKRVKELFVELKEMYTKEAVINSEKDLLDESRFNDLYQAKYKPFQGFRINILGYKKCSETKIKTPSTHHQVKPE